jgi:hypothetical protein
MSFFLRWEERPGCGQAHECMHVDAARDGHFAADSWPPQSTIPLRPLQLKKRSTTTAIFKLRGRITTFDTLLVLAQSVEMDRDRDRRWVISNRCCSYSIPKTERDHLSQTECYCRPTCSTGQESIQA